ncbi:MAG: CDP-glycerol glycerophosphotransferase family protein [Desulfobacteraceae bacterium]|nr:CDP-glycerol glycerophosphotransferase family protein [Desulfobacteraceae bacterium]
MQKEAMRPYSKSNFFRHLKDRFYNILHSKRKRKDIKNYFRYIRNIKRASTLRENYRKIFLKIKNRLDNPDEKLKIIFTVSQRTKWNCQKLFELLDKSERIDCKIALLKPPYDDFDVSLNNIEYQKDYNFFKKINNNLISLYDIKTNQQRSLKTLNADIIFHQQPIKKLVENQPLDSLNAYIHYSFSLLEKSDFYYRSTFFFNLWKYYCESETQAKAFFNINKSHSSRVKVVGYPKLDTYFGSDLTDYKKLWKSGDIKLKRIIYAPSHSLKTPPLLHGTFHLNYQYFLKLAKTNTQIQWILSPHPRLKIEVKAIGLMTNNEYRNYLNEWDMLPNAKVFENGNYFEIFKTSDALITDCESFLGEYLPTKKPIIQLTENCVPRYNEFGNKLIGNFYQANNNKEVEHLIQDVIILNNDKLKEARINMIKYLIPYNQYASEKIKNDLYKLFELECGNDIVDIKE